MQQGRKGCDPLSCSALSSLESPADGNHCPGCMNLQPEDVIPPELLHRLSSFHLIFISACVSTPKTVK